MTEKMVMPGTAPLEKVEDIKGSKKTETKDDSQEQKDRQEILDGPGGKFVKAEAKMFKQAGGRGGEIGKKVVLMMVTTMIALGASTGIGVKEAKATSFRSITGIIDVVVSTGQRQIHNKQRMEGQISRMESQQKREERNLEKRYEREKKRLEGNEAELQKLEERYQEDISDLEQKYLDLIAKAKLNYGVGTIKNVIRGGERVGGRISRERSRERSKQDRSTRRERLK